MVLVKKDLDPIRLCMFCMQTDDCAKPFYRSGRLLFGKKNFLYKVEKRKIGADGSQAP